VEAHEEDGGVDILRAHRPVHHPRVVGLVEPRRAHLPQLAGAESRPVSRPKRGLHLDREQMLLRLEVEAAEDEFALEGDRFCRPWRFRKRDADHVA
jgi:hypothetical protein